MNVGSVLTPWVRYDPGRSAIAFEGRQLSYGELDDLAGRVSAALRARGIGRGDTIALHLPDIPEFIICYLGIVRADAIAVSVNPSLTRPEVTFLLEDSGSRACFTTEPGRELRVPQAGVQVQSGTGQVAERLRHEGGGQARVVRQRVDHVAVEDEPVGAGQRVG